MAVIKKYNSKRNPDGHAVEYQQSVSVSGVAVSAELILPAGGSHGFTFITTGSGTPQVSMSSVEDIEAGNGVWADNDLPSGPVLAATTIGVFNAVSGIRIRNASGDSTLAIVTKAN